MDVLLDTIGGQSGKSPDGMVLPDGESYLSPKIGRDGRSSAVNWTSRCVYVCVCVCVDRRASWSNCTQNDLECNFSKAQAPREVRDGGFSCTVAGFW